MLSIRDCVRRPRKVLITGLGGWLVGISSVFVLICGVCIVVGAMIRLVLLIGTIDFGWISKGGGSVVIVPRS